MKRTRVNEEEAINKNKKLIQKTKCKIKVLRYDL